MHKSPDTSEPDSSDRGSFVSRSHQRRWTVPLVALACVILAAVTLSAAVRVIWVDVYTVEQDSMLPTLADSERILVHKGVTSASDLSVGDVVVFDAEGSFTPYRGGPSLQRTAEQVGHWFGLGSPSEAYVKRVIGTGGDTVECCDDQGRVVVNGQPLEETYLGRDVEAEDPASDISFEVQVPPGRMWVMGDHREDSVDSRHLLGAPGGGMISEERVIGRATSVVWPLENRRSIEGDPW